MNKGKNVFIIVLLFKTSCRYIFGFLFDLRISDGVIFVFLVYYRSCGCYIFGIFIVCFIRYRFWGGFRCCC